jgi:hypothetical protein
MTEYEQAYREFFIAKKWMKGNKELLKAEYEDNELDIPCDGYVQTKEHAAKAVRYYKAFRDKLIKENDLSEQAKIAFKRTINKYENWEEQS